MKISFYVNEVYGGWNPTDKRLGGTEESIVEWSKRIAAKGHEVTVYHNSPSGFYEDYEGVHYEAHDRYIGGADVCINVKSSHVSPREPTLYLTNETNATDLDLSGYSGVIWPSHWAADNIPVNNKNIFILPHGYDKDGIYPTKKQPKQCFYASSPDRGLDTLLKAWPEVYGTHPDATLVLTYGVKNINLPGVICVGDAGPELMNDIYRTSDIWCHPCNGGELFCMTGIKAQVAQCLPVIIPTMALRETVRHGIFLDPQHLPGDYHSYTECLLAALNGDGEEQRKLLAKEHYPDWDETTDILMNIINTVV